MDQEYVISTTKGIRRFRASAAETIRLSPAVKWFAQAVERFRLEYEIDPSDPNYGITHANRRLQGVLDPNEDPCRKIEYCILLVSTLLSIAWSEHCKLIDKEKP